MSPMKAPEVDAAVASISYDVLSSPELEYMEGSDDEPSYVMNRSNVSTFSSIHYYLLAFSSKKQMNEFILH